MDAQITLEEVQKEDQDIIKNLYPLFLHDLSVYDTDEVVDNKGKYDLTFLDNYWQSEDLIPFLIRIDEKIAGFILMQKGYYAPPSNEDYYIGQLFVLRNYRCEGVGERAIALLFSRYPGSYLLGILPENTPAIHFWEAFYEKYGIDYETTTETITGHELIIYRFKVTKPLVKE